MSAAPYKKVDRQQVYLEVKKMIEKSGNNEIEISSSELADKFDVQAPTMDYHLGKLIDSGSLIISSKRGRYNRKIYRLPSAANTTEDKPKTEIHKPFESDESKKKYEEFLKRHLKSSQKEDQDKTEEEPPVEVVQDEAKKEDEIPVEDIVIQEEIIKEEVSQPVQEEIIVEEPKKEVINVKELSLDEQINHFLEASNQVHDAHMLLEHEDREILSVMNETISQTVVYLKDLSEQLSTIQNKQLIQGLIDDRNRMQKQMERLEKEVEESRAQASRTIEQYEVDPQRVRFMHQMIVSTVDNYVNLPNHAMALGRKEFRGKALKEVGDLVKYVLHLEK